MIDTRLWHEWNTNLRIATVEVDGKPRVMVRETPDQGEPDCYLFVRKGANQRIQPADRTLDFDGTVAYWARVLAAGA